MNEHREFFRKRIKSSGLLLLPKQNVPFQVRDLSVEGFQAHFENLPPFETGDEVNVRLPDLRLQGLAKAVRIDPEGPEGAKGYQVGFVFIERSDWNPASVFMG
jgi:hypothetical protein